MIVLGLDPGLDGALASWDGESLVVFPMGSFRAKNRGRVLDETGLNDALDLLFPDADHAFVELVGARPGQGVSSMFKFGVVCGVQRGLIAARRVPITSVRPQAWKREFGVQAAKDAAVARACELFPSSAHEFRGPRGGGRDGPAEAALIALYGFRKLAVKEARDS